MAPSTVRVSVGYEDIEADFIVPPSRLPWAGGESIFRGSRNLAFQRKSRGYSVTLLLNAVSSATQMALSDNHFCDFRFHDPP